MRGKDCIVIGVEKKSIPALQDDRTIRKIHMIDDHVMLAFAGTWLPTWFNSTHTRQHSFFCCVLGLSADARVLVDRARIECQSYKLTLEDPVTVAYISRYIANTKQVGVVLLLRSLLLSLTFISSVSHSLLVGGHSVSPCWSVASILTAILVCSKLSHLERTMSTLWVWFLDFPVFDLAAYLHEYILYFQGKFNGSWWEACKRILRRTLQWRHHQGWSVHPQACR